MYYFKYIYFFFFKEKDGKGNGQLMEFKTVLFPIFRGPKKRPTPKWKTGKKTRAKNLNSFPWP